MFINTRSAGEERVLPPGLTLRAEGVGLTRAPIPRVPHDEAAQEGGGPPAHQAGGTLARGLQGVLAAS